MRGIDGEETCPTCFRDMIELAGFDARVDAIPVDKGGWSGGGRAWREFDWEVEMVGRTWDRLRAGSYQSRIERILRRWPGSLYCSECGYILKRR